jgi:hypothetical protein
LQRALAIAQLCSPRRKAATGGGTQMTTCGIYGFEFTRPFQAAGLEFLPLYRHPGEARKFARDNDIHHLTGTVSGARLLDDQCTHRLEAVLSFIEHLDVRLSEPSDDDASVATAPLSQFAPVLRLGRRYSGGGADIDPDTTPPHQDARKDFIERAMDRLADDAFCEASKFRLLFFKAAETFRQRSPFLEVSYFLLMSGLEAFARAKRNDFTPGNAAQHIACVLKDYGFNVIENGGNSLPRAISTYLHIRNSIFHNGELAPTVRLDSLHVTLPSEDYLYHLQMLVCLTVMKVLDFEDLHRNWDGWFDHMPHGNLGQQGWDEFFEVLQGNSPP